jgi:hypothetical protein
MLSTRTCLNDWIHDVLIGRGKLNLLNAVLTSTNTFCGKPSPSLHTGLMFVDTKAIQLHSHKNNARILLMQMVQLNKNTVFMSVHSLYHIYLLVMRVF